jgi:hypothetical protein
MAARTRRLLSKNIGKDIAAAEARRRRLSERLQTEWIAGAEEEWRKRIGRPMTADELERVLRRYPGAVKP